MLQNIDASDNYKHTTKNTDIFGIFFNKRMQWSIFTHQNY